MYSPEKWIEGDGPSGGTMIVLDWPSGMNWGRRVHLWGDEKKLLDQTLRVVGIDPKRCYLTYSIPFPPEAKKPSKEEIAIGSTWLEEEIQRAQPQRIVLMGGTAYAVLHKLDRPVNVIDYRGRLEWYIHPDWEGCEPTLTMTTIPPYFVISDSDQFRDLSRDLNRLATSAAPTPAPSNSLYVVRSPDELRGWFLVLRSASVISVDIETTGFDVNKDTIIAIGFGALRENHSSLSVVVPLELIYNPEIITLVGDFLCHHPRWKQFEGVFAFHNAKFDLRFLMVYTGRSFLDSRIHDTILMNYLLDERPITTAAKPHGLKSISRYRYDASDYAINFDEFFSSTSTPADLRELYEYLGLDLHYTAQLHFDLAREMTEESPRLHDVLEKLLMPGLKAFVEIEHRGILIDREYMLQQEANIDALLQTMMADLRQSILACEGQVEESRRPSFRTFIAELNPNSYKNIQTLLYDFLQLPDRSKKMPTDKETLQTLEHKYSGTLTADIVRLILKYREQSKALSTSVRGLIEVADANNRVHSEFNLNGTATGRLSSSNPNLQNIPTLMGPVIRKAFIAPPGWVFAEVDYSQLELRVSALLSGDPIMKRAYLEKRDIHKEVAAAAFGVPYDAVTYEQRYAAKYIDFGVIYGRSAESLATGQELIDYDWTVEQAQRFIDQFLGQFVELKKWIQGQHLQVRQKQYIETLTGRRRRWPLILPRELGHAQRQSVNTPIQGLASDFTLTALIKIHRLLKDRGFKASIVSTVHDSILFEIPYAEVDDVCQLIRETMIIPPIECDVPIQVDVEIGMNWGELEEWEKEWWYHPESDDWIHASKYVIWAIQNESLMGPFKTREITSSSS